MTAPTKGAGSAWVGRSIRRLEDPALLTGRGRFTADLPAAHQVRFVRSAVAAGRIVKIAVPDNVTFEPNIEYTNPDRQHLQLDMARPKTGDGPFPAIVCIHGGGFRAGARQEYDGLCIRLQRRRP